MSRVRVVPDALGSRIAEGNPLWYVATPKRSLLAFRTPLSVREYTAGCPRYVLMHNDVGAERPAYYGHASMRRMEEHAREILCEALRHLEASA